MAVERLHPAEDDQVIREIIPGGYAPREFLLYPNAASAQSAQRLQRSRLVPNFLAAFVDDGMPVDGDYLGINSMADQTEAVEEGLSDAA